MERRSIREEEIAFMGDDLVDIPVLMRVGFPVTVASAPPEVRKLCIYVTMREEGRGAFRELVELILKLRGVYEELVKKYKEGAEIGQRIQRQGRLHNL